MCQENKLSVQTEEVLKKSPKTMERKIWIFLLKWVLRKQNSMFSFLRKTPLKFKDEKVLPFSLQEFSISSRTTLAKIYNYESALVKHQMSALLGRALNVSL